MTETAPPAGQDRITDTAACGAQDWAYDDNDEPFIYGTCEMRVLGSDAARAVGRFNPDGPIGYRAKSLPDGPIRATRAEAERDEADVWIACAACEHTKRYCWEALCRFGYRCCERCGHDHR